MLLCNCTGVLKGFVRTNLNTNVHRVGLHYTINLRFRGRGSVVGIATAYGMAGPGIESRWVEIFHISPDRP